MARNMAGCVKCEKSKVDRHRRQTKLVPIPTEECLFEEVAIDFLRELPESQGFNTILVVTNQCTKVQHYAPAKRTCTAKDITDSYINNIWKLYGLLGHIPSDCGLQFASKFLTELNQKLNINLRLSTTCNPQTDRLYE